MQFFYLPLWLKLNISLFKWQNSLSRNTRTFASNVFLSLQVLAHFHRDVLSASWLRSQQRSSSGFLSFVLISFNVSLTEKRYDTSGQRCFDPPRRVSRTGLYFVLAVYCVIHAVVPPNRLPLDKISTAVAFVDHHSAYFGKIAGLELSLHRRRRNESKIASGHPYIFWPQVTNAEWAPVDSLRFRGYWLSLDHQFTERSRF